MQIKLSDHFTYGRLLRFTFPSIAMMIFTSIYGVVDGFFVSNFAGKTPFAAVNLIMPLLMIVATVGFLFGTGGTAIVSNVLGQGDRERANRYFSLFTYLSLGLGIFFSLLGFVLIRPISRMLGAQGALLENCVVYGRIILLATPFYILQLLFQSFFVTAEKPKLGLAVTVCSGVTNMVLDAVLVTLLPQHHKLAGAAVATSISQAVGSIVPLVYFFRENTSLLRLGPTRYDGGAVAQATINGSSEFMSNISMSLVGTLFNLQLMHYAGENGVAAYGVMMYVSMIFSGAFIGYSIGTAPVIGFHYGAQNHAELKSLLRKSLVLLSILGICMTAAAELMAQPLAQFFVGYDPALMQLTISGFRIFALCFLFMGFAVFASGFFTALSDGLTSALISFLRTLVFEVAAVLILPKLLGIDGIWFSIVAADMLSVVLSFCFLAIKRKKYHY